MGLDLCRFWRWGSQFVISARPGVWSEIVGGCCDSFSVGRFVESIMKMYQSGGRPPAGCIEEVATILISHGEGGLYWLDPQRRRPSNKYPVPAIPEGCWFPKAVVLRLRLEWTYAKAQEFSHSCRHSFTIGWIVEGKVLETCEVRLCGSVTEGS